MTAGTDFFSEFVEHARRGKIITVGVEEGRTKTTKFPQSTYWAVPVFDFGSLTYSKDDMDELGKEFPTALSLIGENGVQLPFPRCIFAFTDPDKTCRGEWLSQPDFFELIQEEDRIYVHNFFRSIVRGKAVWMYEDDRVSFDRFTREAQMPDRYAGFIDGKTSDHVDIVRQKVQHTVLAATMINMKRAKQVVQESCALASVNLGRAKANLSPISNTIKISIAESEATGKGRGGSRPSSVRSPHDRRSHFRTLASGKVIAVRASAIHGGASTPRHYEVRL